MKNSRKSQIAVIIGLAITIILSYILFMGVKWGLPVMKFYILTYILFIIAVGIIIYYIAMSKSKTISITISIVAIIIDLLVLSKYATYGGHGVTHFDLSVFLMVISRIPMHVSRGGIFLALLPVFVALLVTFINDNKSSQSPKEKSIYTNHMSNTNVDTSNLNLEEITLEKKEKRTLLIFFIVTSVIAITIAILFHNFSITVPMTFKEYVLTVVFILPTCGIFTGLFYSIFIAPKAVKRLEEAKERKAEETKYNEYNKYSDCFGTDKRMAMLLDEQKYFLEKISSIANTQNRLQANQGLFLQKEHDPYIHGGIATGIAGAGAGVVRALEIQQKNAEIRAQNAKELEYLQKVSNVFSRSTDNYKQRAKALAEEIEGISKKMVSEDSPVSCFEKLEYTYTRVSVTDLGSCIVKVNVKIPEPFFISDNVEGIIDGTIIAEIYDGNVCIGKANLVLPKYGIKYRRGAELTGMALFCGAVNKNYTVKFCPSENLWAMEK